MGGATGVGAAAVRIRIVGKAAKLVTTAGDATTKTTISANMVTNGGAVAATGGRRLVSLPAARHLALRGSITPV